MPTLPAAAILAVLLKRLLQTASAAIGAISLSRRRALLWVLSTGWCSTEAVPTSPLSAIQTEDLYTNIFPNPISNFITVNGASANYQIYIYDLEGSLVKYHKAESKSSKINLSKLVKGSYIIELKDSKNKTSEFRKVIVKR